MAETNPGPRGFAERNAGKLVLVWLAVWPINVFLGMSVLYVLLNVAALVALVSAIVGYLRRYKRRKWRRILAERS